MRVVGIAEVVALIFVGLQTRRILHLFHQCLTGSGGVDVCGVVCRTLHRVEITQCVGGWLEGETV
ncbi:MAG: hypothetical protein KIG89_08590 [Prevotella sp.]|nr:hypothetical protein [Prevotella sp.]